jgi:hypothetical protein
MDKYIGLVFQTTQDMVESEQVSFEENMRKISQALE